MKHVENIRYAQEQLIADRLLSSIQVSSFLHARKMKALEEGRNNNRLTDRLRKQFVELNPILTPRIYEVYSLVAESLGLGSEVTIFCSNENQINASVTIEPTLTEEDKDSYIMVITSQALERLTENELRYLIGHELGHILFSHHKILPIGDLVKTGKDSDEDQPSTGLPILTERDYLQWKIMSEISCDRAGFLACDSIDCAILTILKSNSNIKASLLTPDVESIISYMETLCKHHVDSTEAFSSHPYLPVRIVTLAAFAHSQSIEELAEIDKKVDFYFSSMSRYPLSDLDEAVMKTVSATGLAVIQHDGYVRDEQLNRLVEILYTNFVDDPVSQIDWACKMCNNELLTAYIKIINEQASSRIKLFILYNLCKLALLDGDFDRSEQDFITSIGQRLLLSNSEIKNLIISTIQNEGLKIDPHIKNLVKLINSQNSQSNFSTFYGHVSTPIIKREGNSSVERRDVDLVI